MKPNTFEVDIVYILIQLLLGKKIMTCKKTHLK